MTAAVNELAQIAHMRFDNRHHPFEWRVPVRPRFSLEQWHRDTDLQRLFDQHAVVVINHSADPIDLAVDDGFRDTARSLGIMDRMIFVTCDWLQRHRDHQTVYWPCMLDLMQHHHALTVAPVIQSRQHRVGCLNGMPRPHRFLALHLLESHGMDQDAVIVCHGLLHHYTGELLSWDHEWFRDLPPEVTLRLQQDAYHRQHAGSGWQHDQHGMSHPAMTECYLNLVTESDMGHSVFLSEKTYKPLLAGQLWITVGQQHHHQALRWFGFDCFDDVFDQHRYDQASDWQQRTHQAIDTLRAAWTSLPEIYHSSHERLLHNQQLCRSDQFRDQLRRGLRDHDLILEQHNA